MPEKVSVIVTVYDRNELIDRCMESITGQTLSDIEILCISSLEKKNKKCIDDWCTRDSRVRQIDTSLYMTVAEALNAAIDIAGGEYIAFIDTDDYYYEKNALELLADACAKNNTDIAGAGIVEVNMFNADVRTQFDGIYSGYVFEKDGVTEYREYACDYGYKRFLYRRQFLVDNNILFPPFEYMYDNVFIVRAMVAAGRFASVSRVLYAQMAPRPVVWTDRVANDILRALCMNLRSAAECDIEGLKTLTINRILREYVFIIKDHTVPGNPEMLDIMAELEDIPYGSLEDVNLKLAGMPEGDIRFLDGHVYKRISSVILGMIIDHKTCIEHDLNCEKDRIINQNSVLAENYNRVCSENAGLVQKVARLNARMKLYDNNNDNSAGRIQQLEAELADSNAQIEILKKRGKSPAFYIGRIFTFIPEKLHEAFSKTRISCVNKKDILYWALVVYFTYFIYKLAF